MFVSPIINFLINNIQFTINFVLHNYTYIQMALIQQLQTYKKKKVSVKC